ncbi:MAG: hypothetical protein COA78_17530 [Blastopirellula sp.]|nr:MAG: hypothetical protein COA78_17530 [Blastopirellula sp.]
MIFVFGSNLSGIHGAGAAKYALEKHGAEWGVGEGLTGQSYALPTKGLNIVDMTFDEVDESIVTFVNFAKDNPTLTFHLTPVGCGLAGHRKSDVWNTLKREGLSSNVLLTSTWVTD